MKIAPSILSADFAKLGQEIADIEKAGADYIHVDVMDGHFVDNLTFGPDVIKAVRPYTKLPLDVHLMISNPEKYIETYVNAGADIITIHLEAAIHSQALIQQIKQNNVKAGITINPGTDVRLLRPLLDFVDLVLIMSVNPGFGGQSFIPEMVDKIAWLDQARKENDYDFEIEVDGGINDQTAKICYQAGCDVFVAGSYIFGAEDREKAIRTLKGVAKDGR